MAKLLFSFNLFALASHSEDEIITKKMLAHDQLIMAYYCVSHSRNGNAGASLS